VLGAPWAGRIGLPQLLLICGRYANHNAHTASLCKDCAKNPLRFVFNSLQTNGGPGEKSLSRAQPRETPDKRFRKGVLLETAPPFQHDRCSRTPESGCSSRDCAKRAGPYLFNAQDRGNRVALDMDWSESPVHGEQEGSAYNGHFETVCYHPLFLFGDNGDCCEAATGNVHRAEGGRA